MTVERLVPPPLEEKDHALRAQSVLRVHDGRPLRNVYIGMTSNLNARVFEHKFHRAEGFTDKYHVERLVYCESFDYVHKAINREKQLKGWRRSMKIALIESLNPHWLDLAREWYPRMKESDENRGGSTSRDDSQAHRLAPLTMTRKEETAGD